MNTIYCTSYWNPEDNSSLITFEFGLVLDLPNRRKLGVVNEIFFTNFRNNIEFLKVKTEEMKKQKTEDINIV